MNYPIALFSILLCIMCSIFTEEYEPVLEHAILKVIDGTSIGIDGYTIGFMLKVRREIITLLTEQKYPYQDTTLTIPEFRAIEAELEATKHQLPSGTYFTTQECLHQALYLARVSFLHTVKPFMEQAHGAKKQMLMLISEWSEKRDRPDTYMLSWGRVPEDKEAEEFHKIGISFAIFEDFCHDLISFLQDLIRSCPKGLAQFKKLLAEKKLEHIIT